MLGLSAIALAAPIGGLFPGPGAVRMAGCSIARSRRRRRRGASHQITIHCFAFIGGSRIYVCLKLMRSKPFPVRLVPMLSLSDLSGQYGASTLIGPYFGTKAILSGSSRITRPITTNIGVTAGWPELRRLNGAACPHRQLQNLSYIPGDNIAKAYFRPQLPPELEFDTDTSKRRCWED